jgi:quercetin dioxygenase-like cupin family protein
MTATVQEPVRAGQDRRNRPFHFLNGTFHCKVSASETGGGLCVIDTIRETRGGPPLHFHDSQDEWFLVTEGVFEIEIDGRRHRLSAGDSILAPRGLPHAFVNTTETGRLIVAFQPAGSMEAFFDEGSRLDPMTPQAFAVLFAAHGMRVVGPPLVAARPESIT